MRNTFWVFVVLWLASDSTTFAGWGRGYPNLRAVSPNGRYTLTATRQKNPPKKPSKESGKAWPTYFEYVLTDMHTKDVVWTRHPSQGEAYPTNVFAADDRRAILWTGRSGGRLVLLGPNGKETGQLGICSDLFTEEERKTHVRGTSAGIDWQNRHEYVTEVEGTTFFVIRTAWDRRIVVDLETSQTVQPGPDLRTALEHQEKQYAIATLQKMPLGDALGGLKHADYQSFYMAMHIAGRLQVREAIPLLRAVEADGRVSATTAANEINTGRRMGPIWWRKCGYRRAAQVALRRLGERPRPFPTLVLKNIRTKQHVTLTPNDTLPEQRENVVDDLHKGATLDEVLKALGPPSYARGFREEAWWRYEMDTDPPYTLIVTWHEGRIRSIQKRTPPLWQSERRCEGDFTTQSHWSREFVSEQHRAEMARRAREYAKATNERAELLRGIVLPAAAEARRAAGAAPSDGDYGKPPAKKTGTKAFRGQCVQAVAAARPGIEAVVGPVIDAIEGQDLRAMKDAIEASATAHAEDAAVVVLAEALNHEKEEIRILAAETLAELGLAAETAVPALIAALRDECEYVRHHAAEALGNIGPEAHRAVPALILSLADDRYDSWLDAYVRVHACESLGKIGAQPKIVVPVLIAAVKYGENDLRAEAVRALGEFSVRAASAAPVVAEALDRDKDHSVRSNAARALASIDPEGRVSIPALTKAMHPEKQGTTVRRRVAEAIAKIGPKARATAPILLKTLEERDLGVRVAAAKALWKVERNADASVPVLVRVLEGKGIARVWAADALSEIGPEAKDAVAALRKMLSSTNSPSRVAAVRALGNIGLEASVAVPRLVELLDDKDWHMRGCAAGALWKINRHHRAIPALVAELQRDNYEGPLSAVISIGEIGPAAKEAVPGLIKMLSHRELFVRREAARALKKVDPSSMPMSAKE